MKDLEIKKLIDETFSEYGKAPNLTYIRGNDDFCLFYTEEDQEKEELYNKVPTLKLHSFNEDSLLKVVLASDSKHVDSGFPIQQNSHGLKHISFDQINKSSLEEYKSAFVDFCNSRKS